MHASRRKKEKPELLALIHSTPVEKTVHLSGPPCLSVLYRYLPNPTIWKLRGSLQDFPRNTTSVVEHQHEASAHTHTHTHTHTTHAYAHGDTRARKLSKLAHFRADREKRSGKPSMHTHTSGVSQNIHKQKQKHITAYRHKHEVFSQISFREHKNTNTQIIHWTVTTVHARERAS